MRILVLTTDAFGGRGGIAKFNRDLLKALCSHPSCTEVIAVPRYMPEPAGCLPSRLVYITEGLNGKYHYVVNALRAALRHGPPDLILCGHISLLPVAFLLRSRFQVSVWLQIYGVEAWRPSRNPLIVYLAERIDGLISISRCTRGRFLDWAEPRRVREWVLPCAVDLNRYVPSPKSNGLLLRYGLEGKTVLMTLGRLSSDERYKGVDEILNLLPVLTKEVPHLIYLVCGDGPDRKRLEQKAENLHVGRNVVFTGFIREGEKADHYRLADAFAMPGYGEGFGIVFLEAMACGIPVVASKLDGSREAVRDGLLGVLVDPTDPHELKAGLLEALRRPKGVVPEGLEYFSYSRFEQRCRLILDQWTAEK